MNEKAYDETDPISIEKYSQNLIGKTFSEICKVYKPQKLVVGESEDYEVKYENKRRKGGLGELIEERFFHYRANNNSNPDFEEAGVELKVTPYKKNRNGTIAAKERLIITMIDYFKIIDECFEESHLWNKANLMLLVYYLYEQEIKSRLDYRIDYVKLFSPPEKDVEIIKQDFKAIVQKVKSGRAHELSEGDTLYLGAASKSVTSKDRRKQPFSDNLAKPRAFSFKSSYMTYVLNNYIVPGEVTYEPIVKTKIEKSFEEYIIDKIHFYKGYAIQDLCTEFGISFDKRPKNLEAILAYRILGIKGNHAEEFEKANVVVKSIRVGNNNRITESMSFPTFKFNELIQEEWETSTLYTYLSEARFLFVVYKFDENQILRLKGCQFWNIPNKDLEEEVRSIWEKTVKVIKEGVEITTKKGRNYNNLPGSSENHVCHVRPHARNAQDTYELPDGRKLPKQCFWLNNRYILSQLDNKFLK